MECGDLSPRSLSHNNYFTKTAFWRWKWKEIQSCDKSLHSKRRFVRGANNDYSATKKPLMSESPHEHIPADVERAGIHASAASVNRRQC